MNQPAVASQLYFGTDYVKPSATLTDFALTYLLNYAETNLRESSYKRVLYALKSILACFGNRPLESLTSRDIEEYQTARSLRVKPLTVNHDVAILKHMLNKAVDWDYLEASPAVKVKSLKVEPYRERYLTYEERERLLEKCAWNDMLYAVVLTALETGMRRGELMRLKWNDVDLKNYRITLTRTKNNENRIVPISNRLYPVLEALHESRYGEYIFSKPDGKPYGDWKKSFRGACNRAGIKDFRFHDLRHTFASWLVMSGVNIRTVQELMGHKDIKMTMRYSHLSQEHLLDAVNGMGRQKLQTDLPHNIAPVAQRIERWFPKPLLLNLGDLGTLEINLNLKSMMGQGTAEGHYPGGRSAEEGRKERTRSVSTRVCA